MINNTLLAKVLNQVANRFTDPDDVLVTHLRKSYPGTHFSICNDDDMPPKLSPAAGNTFCRLYYVDSTDHCLRLTNDHEAATGLVVALRDWDDA